MDESRVEKNNRYMANDAQEEAHNNGLVVLTLENVGQSFSK